jgi:hypothetical protein
MRSTIVPVAFILLSCLGCQKGSDYTCHIRGTVTLDGKPLTSGNVLSSPQNGGRGAIADIQSDGTFALKTGRDLDGVAPGKHLITVVAYQPDPTNTPQFESNRPLAIPERYTDPARSGFSVDVAPGQEQVIELKLVTRN